MIFEFERSRPKELKNILRPSLLFPGANERSYGVPNYGKKLIVEPGAKIKLNDLDPGSRGKHESPEAALPEVQKNLEKMDQLQYLMYAENKHSALIVLQGLDSAGKDGV